MSRYQELLAELETHPKRWLVTGAAGFIGSALTEVLLAHGQQVTGFDNFATGHKENLDDVRAVVGDEAYSRFTFIEGSICDADAIARACKNIDYVLHQAALGSVPRSLKNPYASHDANVSGFLQTLLAARDAGVKRLVYASSSSVYGDNPTLPKQEGSEGEPLSPYAATKKINETYAKVIQRSYQLEIIGLRYFNVFGRRQDPNGPYAAVIPRWIDDLFSGRACNVFGDGTNSRDFCYIDNAVQANLLAATCHRDATGRAYNVGLGGRTDLNTLHRLLAERVQQHSHTETVPASHGEPRPGDVPHSQAAINAIVSAMGYEPTHDIAAGLTETVNWFASKR